MHRRPLPRDAGGGRAIALRARRRRGQCVLDQLRGRRGHREERAPRRRPDHDARFGRGLAALDRRRRDERLLDQVREPRRAPFRTMPLAGGPVVELASDKGQRSRPRGGPSKRLLDGDQRRHGDEGAHRRRPLTRSPPAPTSRKAPSSLPSTARPASSPSWVQLVGTFMNGAARRRRPHATLASGPRMALRDRPRRGERVRDQQHGRSRRQRPEDTARRRSDRHARVRPERALRRGGRRDQRLLGQPRRRHRDEARSGRRAAPTTLATGTESVILHLVVDATSVYWANYGGDTVAELTPK